MMERLGELGLEAFGSLILPGIFTLSFVVFAWASAKYLIQGDHHEEEQEKAKLLMAYAVFMFWVMVILYFVASWIFGNLDRFIFVR